MLKAERKGGVRFRYDAPGCGTGTIDVRRAVR